MKWSGRKNGISVLIPTQNEEEIVSLCLLSFLEFGDELIVVDNGSTDRTKEIVQDIQSAHPAKIKFFDRPELPDLYHNRQFAFSQSVYRWVIRADADYVAYTDGKYDIRKFREKLLATRAGPIPKIYAVPQANITGDFWHTGIDHNTMALGKNDPGRYVPPPVSVPMVRVYEVFPGFKFQRVGRGEGTTFNYLMRFVKRKLAHPLWMHCTLKSSVNLLFRSERTNWRELGDFVTYPTLESYIRSVILQKYGTIDIDEAAEIYLKDFCLPFLQPYDPEKFFPYPDLVQKQIAINPIYQIKNKNGAIMRDFLGTNQLVRCN